MYNMRFVFLAWGLMDKKAMFSETQGKQFPGEKCVSNCGAILETSDKPSTPLTDVWGGGYSGL